MREKRVKELLALIHRRELFIFSNEWKHSTTSIIAKSKAEAQDKISRADIEAANAELFLLTDAFSTVVPPQTI